MMTWLKTTGRRGGWAAALAILGLAASPLSAQQVQQAPARTPPPQVTPQQQRPSAAQQQQQPAPAQPQQPQQVRPRPAPQQRPATPPAQAPEAAPQQFQMSGGARHMILRLTPEKEPDRGDLAIVEGTSFTTDVMLGNPARRQWDQLRIVLDYNPSFLDPVSVNDSELSNRLAGSPRATVDRRLGQIVYEARLAQPLDVFERPLLFVKWNAIKPVLFTPIAFGRTRAGEHFELFRDGAPLLGDPDVPGDGSVPINVSIIPSDPAEALMMQEDPQLYLGSTDRVGGVQLVIRNPETPPRVGETFQLPLVLDNRAYSRLDGLSLIIEYDPATIEILDDDWDNWITLGTNIHDGTYREDFPWDYHMANAVYSARGLIEYRVGTSTTDEFVGVHGVFADITARAKTPTAGTAVRFLFSRQAGQRTTQVVYLGQNVLGETNVRNDGVRGAFFPILP